MNDNESIKIKKTINLPEDKSAFIVKHDLSEPLESIAESLKSIDRSLQKIAGGKVVKTSEPHAKSYADRYFTFDPETKKVEEKK